MEKIITIKQQGKKQKKKKKKCILLSEVITNHNNYQCHTPAKKVVFTSSNIMDHSCNITTRTKCSSIPLKAEYNKYTSHKDYSPCKLKSAYYFQWQEESVHRTLWYIWNSEPHWGKRSLWEITLSLPSCLTHISVNAFTY